MPTTDDAFAAGRAFIYREGRLLERRVFAALFEDAPARGVLDALAAYRNDDGGFGHGLEPDKRCPASQPLDVLFALQTCDVLGAVDPATARAACDFLASVAGPSGAVPILLPSVAGYPRAEHWGDGRFPPRLHPTAGLVGLLWRFGVAHPWAVRAAEFCWAELAREVPGDAHVLALVLTFLEHAPERERAEALVPVVADALPQAAYFRARADEPSYGLTPLHVAPAPGSRWRGLFDDALGEEQLRQESCQIPLPLPPQRGTAP